MAKSRRTNPGKVELYREAGEVLRENRADLLKIWVAIVATVAVLNLPIFPVYERGLVTGVLLTFTACLSLWLIWYASGLGPRLEGTWAEGFTAEQLQKVTGEVQAIPNLRFDGFDIDHAVVARHGVYAIETKLRRKLHPRALERDAFQAASNGRSLRLYLTKSHRGILPPPDAVFHSLLVIWGRAGVEMTPQQMETPKGTVTVLGGRHLAAWLSQQGRGPLAQDHVDALADALRMIAVTREENHAPDSWVLRWVARVRS